VRRAGRRALLAVLAGASLLVAAPAVAQSPGAVALAPTAGRITFGDVLPLTGSVTRGGTPLAGAVVELELNRYPYRGFVVVASARTAADGHFSLAAVRPSRNALLRVSAPAAGADSVTRTILVNPAVSLRSRKLGRGRTLLTATVVHTRAYGSPPVNTFWYVAARHSRHFTLVAVTRTTDRRGTAMMHATVNPPSRRFSFVVCFVPAWARAMGPPAARLPCRDHDFTAR
jgi:hypothetical protein